MISEETVLFCGVWTDENQHHPFCLLLLHLLQHSFQHHRSTYYVRSFSPHFSRRYILRTIRAQFFPPIPYCSILQLSSFSAKACSRPPADFYPSPQHQSWQPPPCYVYITISHTCCLDSTIEVITYYNVVCVRRPTNCLWYGDQFFLPFPLPAPACITLRRLWLEFSICTCMKISLNKATLWSNAILLSVETCPQNLGY